MFIVGTAGHIDHGKTTLVTKLTGVQTDRLEEEQRRGISIELGFAHLSLPSGLRCGIIDVPGHERFVRQMIAGAVGVDVVLLVVAADEGVMPQTREHLDICRLLGVRRGRVVLTKVDLVDDEWLELVADDVMTACEGTFLEGTEPLYFSAVDEARSEPFRQTLLDYLETEVGARRFRDPSRPALLPVDRVFTIKGFGTVVTGTLASGALAVGDEVALHPLGTSTRVRGLQNHGESVEAVEAGGRVAVNLQGLEKSDIERGSCLVRAGELQATSMFDCTLTVLSHAERPVEARTKALVHVGTDQIAGTIVPLDRDAAWPGDEALAQIRLERPTVLLPGQPYVLRGFEVLQGYGKTFAGGRVLEPHPVKHKSGRESVIEELVTLRDGSPSDLLSVVLGRCAPDGADESTLLRRVSLGREALGDELRSLVSQGVVMSYVDEVTRYVRRSDFDEQANRAVELIAAYHDAHPARPGPPREEIRGQTRWGLGERLFARLISELEARGIVSSEADWLCLEGFEPKVTGRLKTLRDALAALYESALLQPPVLSEAQSTVQASDAEFKEVLDILQREDLLVRVKTDLFFWRPAIDDLRSRMVAFLDREGEITTAQFKELAGLSRKFSIPLQEFFDDAKVTIRSGDNVRKLRPKLG